MIILIEILSNSRNQSPENPNGDLLQLKIFNRAV